jgi:hypothetical protein
LIREAGRTAFRRTGTAAPGSSNDVTWSHSVPSVARGVQGAFPNADPGEGASISQPKRGCVRPSQPRRGCVRPSMSSGMLGSRGAGWSGRLRRQVSGRWP